MRRGNAGAGNRRKNVVSQSVNPCFSGSKNLRAASDFPDETPKGNGIKELFLWLMSEGKKSSRKPNKSLIPPVEQSPSLDWNRLSPFRNQKRILRIPGFSSYRRVQARTAMTQACFSSLVQHISHLGGQGHGRERLSGHKLHPPLGLAGLRCRRERPGVMKEISSQREFSLAHGDQRLQGVVDGHRKRFDLFFVHHQQAA